MRERLETLSEPEQAVLPWAAALGRSFDASVLSQVSGLLTPVLLDGLERLEGHGVLRATSGGGYDFSHDVLRQGASARMSEPRRRLVHRQIATALDAGPEPRPGEVAHHAALAGDHPLAARACVSAGQRCWRLCAWTDAYELSRRGLEHAATLPPTERLPLEVELLGLRRNQRDVSVRAQLDAGFARVAAEAKELGLASVIGLANHYRSLTLFHGGDHEGAHRYSGLLASTPPDGGEVALLRGARCLAVLERDMGEVRSRLEALRARPIPAAAQLDHQWSWGLVHRYEGDYAAAAAELERASAAAARDEEHWERGMLLMSLAFVHLEAGAPAAAAECARRMRGVAAKLGEGVEGPAAEAVLALVEAMAPGGWEPLERSLEAVRRADGKAVLSNLCNFASELALVRAAPGRARAWAQEALEAAQAVNLVSQVLLAKVLLARLEAPERLAPQALAALRRECQRAGSARALALTRRLLARS